MEEKKIDRLLRSAALGSEDVSAEAPFGFDTRIIALWRASGSGVNGLTRLVRRVALIAAAVIVVATAGAFRELNRNRDISEPFGDEFAIADSAIQNEFLQ
jgi:hypothetical protein